MSIAIIVDNKWVTLMDRAGPPSDCLISVKECNKELKKGATTYLLQVTKTTSPSVDILHSITDSPTSVEDILQSIRIYLKNLLAYHQADLLSMPYPCNKAHILLMCGPTECHINRKINWRNW